MLTTTVPLRFTQRQGLKTARNLHRTIMTSSPLIPRQQKVEGDISAVFTSLRPSDPANVFPPRFAELKRTIWNDALVQSWKEVLEALEVETARIAEQGEKLIPQIPIESIHKGLSPKEIARIRAAGCVVVKGAVPVEEAVSWKADIKSYVAANPGQVKGFPADNIQVFELYNTRSQIRARTHPNILETQRALLSLWHDGSGEVRLDTPISYFDRLRMRFPGDAKFTLGPHVDGGSIERWEDPTYRSCFHNILSGAWKSHNPYDAAPRVHAVQDLYSAPSQCSIFRPWQGWTAMSSTGPGEGTLRVLPMLSLATAYWVLRPFFRARDPASSSLKWEDWNELDLEGTGFAGCGLGTGLELNDATHPHLRLDKTMVSMPRVEPGDQVYWHCDMIHAVEGYHGGKEDSSVMYIPAVPLTLENIQYLRDQRTNFLAGLPAPDFPGGPGESAFVGRATVEDVYPGAGRRAVGFEKFETAGEGGRLFAEANSILAF
ncbi:hypothetical protein DFH08DRAFT_896920 [Mycena albidolilacea]|uniref:DUF1479-domain-containing protein n=1 Tax=Mycena albidolilacea TaxID=1033008 RepID=A0AAD6Z8J0_9AGAR|nr:hypothetical protein DFH08DRAFT_896920 [Mycena albidolilacea]